MESTESSTETPKSVPQESKSKTLRRSQEDKVIAGVAGGLGEYFNIDPLLIRLLFILITIYGGTGLLLYIVLWLLMPTDPDQKAFSEETVRQGAEEMRSTAEKMAEDIRVNAHSEQSRQWWGLFLLLFGAVLLLSNFGLMNLVEIGRLWPLILVALGIALITR